MEHWSGRRGSKPRQPAWKAGSLPLSYSRVVGLGNVLSGTPLPGLTRSIPQPRKGLLKLRKNRQMIAGIHPTHTTTLHHHGAGRKPSRQAWAGKDVIDAARRQRGRPGKARLIRMERAKTIHIASLAQQ